MLATAADKPAVTDVEVARLRAQLHRARGENERLRSENRLLRAALDAYIARAGSVALYGSHEMTAGTCTGPRRRPATPHDHRTA
jgi:hypothetical protein